jgi:hypothetical protein
VGLGYALEMFKMLSFPSDSRTTNAATVDLKAELLLHLNFKAMVRRSILTRVPIGHVVRSRHSSPSVA